MRNFPPSAIAELRDLFLELTRYDNSSGQEHALTKLTAQHLKASCSLVRTFKIGNVFARTSGRGKPLILSAHLDSVSPVKSKKITLSRGVFCSDGKTVLGADDLAGVAAILFSLRFCQRQRIATRPLEILFSAQEESGGRGIKAFNFKNFHSREALVIDGNSRIGTIINQASGEYFWRAPLKQIPKIENKKILFAKAAKPEVAQNSKKKLILNCRFLLNTSSSLAVHKCSFQNSKAILQGDIRFQCFPGHQEIKEILRLHFTKLFSFQLTEVELASKPSHFHYTHSPPNFRRVWQVLENLRLKPQLKASLGMSDANTFHSYGIPAVLIGTGARNAHTTQETLALRDLVKLTKVLLAMMRK